MDNNNTQDKEYYRDVGVERGEGMREKDCRYHDIGTAKIKSCDVL